MTADLNLVYAGAGVGFALGVAVMDLGARWNRKHPPVEDRVDRALKLLRGGPDEETPAEALGNAIMQLRSIVFLRIEGPEWERLVEILTQTTARLERALKQLRRAA